MNEKALVDKVLSGDRQAQVEFINQYQRLVVHVISRLIDNNEERQELCQDIFIKVLSKLSNFKFESKISTWIATIAYRDAVSHLKKLNRNLKEEDLDQIDYRVGEESVTFEKTDFSSFVHRLIARMPEQYRIILTLYHLDGFSYPEIVEVTGMPEGTVKNYLFRARKKLKEICEPLVGTEIHLD